MKKIEKHYNGYVIEIWQEKNKWKYRLLDGLDFKYLFESEEIEAETSDDVYAIAVKKLKDELFNF